MRLMRHPFRNVLLGAVAAAVALAASPVWAETCVQLPVTARGEPSSFEWLAKTKAHANWRSRVRATKAIGPAYSNWVRAADRLETCNPSPKGIICTFTGTPCRP